MRMEDIRQLRDFASSYANIPDEEWNYVQPHIHIVELSKGEHLLSNGEVPQYIYFCTKGLLRMYYITDDGNEYNKSFCKENEFITSYSAGLLQIPSHLFIQSLEPSRFLAIPFTFMMQLFDRHPGWERLGRKMVEALYIKKEQKERQFLLLSAEQRYQLFLEEYPDIERRIPQYHIASYLGITPEALSRIRNNKVKK